MFEEISTSTSKHWTSRSAITDRNSKLMTFCCPCRGLLGISTFQRILQDPRTQNIPLLEASPSFDQPKFIHGKEIGYCNHSLALTRRTNPKKNCNLYYKCRRRNESYEIKSGPPKNLKRVGKRTKPTDSDAESTDSFQTRQDGPEQLPEPERLAERESPAKLKRSLWQSYLILTESNRDLESHIYIHTMSYSLVARLGLRFTWSLFDGILDC